MNNNSSSARNRPQASISEQINLNSIQTNESLQVKSVSSHATLLQSVCVHTSP